MDTALIDRGRELAEARAHALARREDVLRALDHDYTDAAAARDLAIVDAQLAAMDRAAGALKAAEDAQLVRDHVAAFAGMLQQLDALVNELAALESGTAYAEAKAAYLAMDNRRQQLRRQINYAQRATGSVAVDWHRSMPHALAMEVARQADALRLRYSAILNTTYKMD